VVGPGFTEVAARYQGKPDSEAYLAQKIKAGGEGVWGPVPMPPQPALRDEEAQAIAKWIAGGAR
jgi:cytochrome c